MEDADWMEMGLVTDTMEWHGSDIEETPLAEKNDEMNTLVKEHSNMIKQTSVDVKIGRQLSRKVNQPVEVTEKTKIVYNKSVWLIAVVTVIALERKNRDDRKEKIMARISNRVEKKTKQRNTNIKKEKEKRRKRRKKEKNNNKNKKPYIQNKNKKYKNKVFLNTTHNKGKYNTSAQNNIKSTIHHIPPNQIKKSSTNSCIHRNTQKTILSNILKMNHGPKKSISQTHPRMHRNKQKTHCYNNNTQLQIHLDKNITHLHKEKTPKNPDL
jgi:hypothetical protein